MIKKIYFVLCLITSFIGVLGQEVPYYEKSYRKNSVINLPNMAISKVRWYVGVEGGFKQNYSKLNNTLSNLISKNNTNDVFWGLQLGYNHDGKWAIETGYLPSPNEILLLINSGRGLPYTVTRSVVLQSIPIRFKKNIWAIDKATKTATVWLGGGVLISPNSKNESLGSFYLSGLARSTDGTNKIDTLKLIENSYQTNRGIVQLESTVELQGKVSDSFGIGVFFRGVYGSGGQIRSDIEYFVNSQSQARANLISNGFSYSLGIVFRYDYTKHIIYKNKLTE